MVGLVPGDEETMTLTQGSADTERELNVLAPELIENPYPWYADMRAEGVVNYTLPGLPHYSRPPESGWPATATCGCTGRCTTGLR